METKRKHVFYMLIFQTSLSLIGAKQNISSMGEKTTTGKVLRGFFCCCCYLFVCFCFLLLEIFSVTTCLQWTLKEKLAKNNLPSRRRLVDETPFSWCSVIFSLVFLFSRSALSRLWLEISPLTEPDPQLRRSRSTTIQNSNTFCPRGVRHVAPQLLTPPLFRWTGGREVKWRDMDQWICSSNHMQR